MGDWGFARGPPRRPRWDFGIASQAHKATQGVSNRYSYFPRSVSELDDASVLSTVAAARRQRKVPPAVGYGFAVHRNRQSLVQGSGRLGPSEVFDAEANGALEGLLAALRLGDTTGSVVVCTDNLVVANCLRGDPADSSQDKFTKFQELASSHGNVRVRWIPGHTNIPGNEEADSLAKAGCLQPEPPGAMPSLAHLRRLARQQSRDAFKTWWSTEAPESNKPLHLEATTSCPPELLLPRATLHSLSVARSCRKEAVERCPWERQLWRAACGRLKVQSLV
ncbi:hypothetical protein PCL_00448 [Purpureocillium lilacinum]|uniref:RNase H type-1 domain-containing protein n=1 Tax=Purpureocillium lilacinum TaxID=33203 RepID=A0A2U3DP49_PURLI|nr:hypothetical protein PCL_00448 [Purpureocillium lilacinum]